MDKSDIDNNHVSILKEPGLIVLVTIYNSRIFICIRYISRAFFILNGRN